MVQVVGGDATDHKADNEEDVGGGPNAVLHPVLVARWLGVAMVGVEDYVGRSVGETKGRGLKARLVKIVECPHILVGTLATCMGTVTPVVVRLELQVAGCSRRER